MSEIKLEVGTIPATPGTGFVTVYPKSDKKLYIKDETGLETDLTATMGSVAAEDVSIIPAGDIVATNVQDAVYELDAEKAPIAHVGSTGVSEHGVASGVVAGFMSPSDKTKLDGVATGATANNTDAFLLDRANHTGTQLAATVTGLAAVATSGSKNDVGLNNVDNTADANKPVSTAQAAADTAVQTYSTNRANHSGTQLAATVSDFTAAAKSAVVQDLISNGVTDLAPSQNAVFDALATKSDITHTHTSSDITNFTSAAKAAVVDDSITDSITDKAPSQNAVFDALAAKVNKAGDTMTGALELSNLTGTAFVGFAPQNPVPSTPTAGFRMYSGSTGRIAFKGTAGIPWSLDYLGLTATRTFTFPDVSGTFMIDPATTAGDIIYRNASNVNTRLPIGSTDDILRVSSGVPSWQPENLTQDFGDGSDGNLTVTGALTLTQIPYYNVLTIGAGAAINTAGYPIYCKVLDLSNAPAGSIYRNGNNGGNSATTPGGAAGAALAAAVLGGSSAGSAGGAGAPNAGTASAAPGSSSPGNGGSGGNSGASGAGGTGAGVVAGAGGSAINYTHYGRFEYSFTRGATLVSGGAGGDGGNSGGGDGANTTRGAGGGGSGGGVLVIYAAEIITSVSTPADVIQAKGGNGGQTVAPAAGNVGGAGGAAGGGGGYIYIAYVERTGPVVASLINASGGNGGNGGNGLGTGIGGNGGQSGEGGKIQTFNVTTGVGTQVIGAASTSGTVGSGVTGGTGANGASCVLSF